MYEYDFHTYSVKKKRSKKKIYLWIGFFLLVTLASIFLRPPKKQQDQIISPVVSEISTIAQKIGIEKGLSDQVQQQLMGKKGSYSVVIKNLKTNESYYFNEHTTYESGSLYKLWIMAVAYEQIHQGKLKEDTSLAGDIAALNKKFHIATAAAELKDGKINFTVKSALQQMITISHNYAALLLTEKVKLSTVKQFLSDHGFSESKVGIDNSAPTTTALDIADFFELLYRGKLEDPESTEKMITLLKGQKLNNKLPKYLPEQTVSAHKTGELGLYSHDAGIVYSDNGDYLIVILSKTSYPPEAEETIAQVSKSVYEYFSAQQ